MQKNRIFFVKSQIICTFAKNRKQHYFIPMKQIISTTQAPAAIGAYSQAVIANGMLFASGQLGIDPATGEFAGEDFRSQAEQAVKNVAAILDAAGTDASHVVKRLFSSPIWLISPYSTKFTLPFSKLHSQHALP